MPEPVFEPGLEPGAGADVWCGETPEPDLGPWIDVQPPRPGVCEFVTEYRVNGTTHAVGVTFRYDADGRVIESRSGSLLVQTRFAPSGHPTLRTWSWANSASTVDAWQVFTAEGQPLWLETAQGAYIDWAYGEDGRLRRWSQFKGPSGRGLQRVEFDARGVPIRIEFELEDGLESLTAAVSIAFDPASGVFRSTLSNRDTGTGTNTGTNTGASMDMNTSLETEETLRCDANGRRVDRHVSPGAAPTRGSYAQTLFLDEAWRYDRNGHLVWAWSAGSGPVAEERRAYDPRGRLLVVESRVDGEPNLDAHDVAVWDDDGRLLCRERVRVVSRESRDSADESARGSADRSPADSHADSPADKPARDSADERVAASRCERMLALPTYHADGALAEVRETCLDSAGAGSFLRSQQLYDAAGRLIEVRELRDAHDSQVARYRYDCPEAAREAPRPLVE